MDVPPAPDPTGAAYEEVPSRSGAGGYLFPLLYLALGGISVALAVDDDFARGKVEFAGDVWRGALGLVGAALAFLGARAVLRALSNEKRRLTPELHRRGAQRGKVLIVVGAALFAMAVFAPLADETIAFSEWAKPLYVCAGALLVLQGLVLQWNPTRFMRQQRVARGEGRPGVARIVRASDTGTSVNDAPQVRIEFELEVGGQVHQVSDKIVIERAKLALLIPGATVNVLVDKLDPNVFHVDWDSWKAP